MQEVVLLISTILPERARRGDQVAMRGCACQEEPAEGHKALPCGPHPTQSSPAQQPRVVALGPRRGHTGESGAAQSWPELYRPADARHRMGTPGSQRAGAESARLHFTEGETEARDAMNHSCAACGRGWGQGRGGKEGGKERKREGTGGPERRNRAERGGWGRRKRELETSSPAKAHHGASNGFVRGKSLRIWTA